MPVIEPDGNLSLPTSSGGNSAAKSMRQGNSHEYAMQSICGDNLRLSIARRIGWSNSCRNVAMEMLSRLPCHGSMKTLIGGIPRRAAKALATARLSLLDGFTMRKTFSGPPPASDSAMRVVQAAIAKATATHVNRNTSCTLTSGIPKRRNGVPTRIIMRAIQNGS